MDRAGGAAPRRATTPRQELLGSAFTVAMALQFAIVVIVGTDLLHGNLPFMLLFFRFGGAAVILAVVLAATGRPMLPVRGERLGIAIAGIVGYGTESALYFSALNHGTAAAVTLLFYTYPVWVMLATIAIDRTFPKGRLVLALLLAIGGSAVVVAGSSSIQLETVGILLAIACSLTYSCYLIGTDRIVKRTNALTSAMWLSAGAAIGNLSYSFIFNSHPMPAAGEWWRVVAMMIFSAGAFVCMLAGLQRIGAVRNAILGVIEPLAVAGLGVIFLNQPITVPIAIGGALILAGAIIATLVRTTASAEPNV